MFPADLPDVDETQLTSASRLYLSAVESEPETSRWFHSGHSSKVEIKAANIRQLQLFEEVQNPCVLLGLHPPDDPTRVVAVYLYDRWWSLDDALRTCSKSRSGLMPVESLVERVMVFLLSQLVDKPSAGEDLFRLHPPTESCKLLWGDGRALGFYSVKHKVVRRFLQQHEEHRERLYEVEAPGGWTQRRNIWLNIQLGRYSIGPEEEESPTETRKNEGDESETRKNEGDESSQKRSGSDWTSQSCHRPRTASRAAEHTDQPDQTVPKGTQNPEPALKRQRAEPDRTKRSTSDRTKPSTSDRTKRSISDRTKPSTSDRTKRSTSYRTKRSRKT
ncbi:protein FAM169B isoform X2 [Acanthochromis polyacanthus]|uniref:protein FAM169B isoform X2 n=1 Tax=Acanthochromis polyacanthus TaxID=80966 RepID=UPI002234C1C5|nr:protein FAM169B isoform X2 [Acanthochromis polyacanthus]